LNYDGRKMIFFDPQIKGVRKK